MRRLVSGLGRAVSQCCAAATLLGLLLGTPLGLAIMVGWPLPTRVPTGRAGWEHLLAAPLPDQAILHMFAVAGWLLWAAFAWSVGAETKAVLRGVRSGRAPATRNPLRAVAAFLILTIAAGGLATTAATARPSHATPALDLLAATKPAVTLVLDAPETTPTGLAREIDTTAAAQAPLLPGGPAVLQINGCSHLYTVTPGDSLWTIAQTCLGDAHRWPEIWQLNKGQVWPAVSGYKALGNPDLILPRWTLVLPADATAPPEAPQAEPVDPPLTTPPPTQYPEPTPALPGPPAPTPNGQPSPATGTTATPPPAAGLPTTTTPTPSQPEPTTITSTPSTAPAPPPGTATTPASANEDGLTLPDGSWLPWTLAAALSAAAAMVWLQRRRRFVPGSTETLTDLPTPVKLVDRAVARHSPFPAPANDIDKAAAVPVLPPLPGGGIGLVGDGAAAAARAALIAALAAGGPHEPHDRSEIVIDATTLNILFDTDRGPLEHWPRLHIATDTEEALAIIEVRLMHRSRIIDQYSLNDLDAVLQTAPDEEALPHTLLICQPPAGDTRMRATVSVGLGARLRISAIILGEWETGLTVEVASDGHTRTLSGTADSPVPDRMAVLEPEPAIEILHTLKEAHTGDPTAKPDAAKIVPLSLALADTAGEPQPATDANDDAEASTSGDAAEAIDGAPTRRPMLRVLGSPHVVDAAPEPILRKKAREVAVFLACHPDGASTREVGEYIAPEYRLKQADQQVHTNASNLRQVLASVGGQRRNAYVLRHRGDPSNRYRLDPATVDVDLWQMQQLVRAASIASGDKRRDLLATACDLYTQPLADKCDYEWIGPHREAVRRFATDTHLQYAECVLDNDPQAASDALDKAIALDPLAEQLYVQAMHARYALRDADGIRILKRAVTKALADIDVEPADETLTLADQLINSLNQP